MKKTMNNRIWLLPLLIVGGIAIGFGAAELAKTIYSLWSNRPLKEKIAQTPMTSGGGFVQEESDDSFRDSERQEAPHSQPEDNDVAVIYDTPQNNEINEKSKSTNSSSGFAIQTIEGPKVEENTQTYSLKIVLTPEYNSRIKGLNSPFLFELYAPNAATPTYSSALGSFSGVLPSATRERQPGKYTLRITDTESGEVIEQEISGFKPIYKKVTASQLTRNFNNGGPSSIIHESDSIRIRFIGSKDPQMPSTLFDVYTRLAANWTRVDVQNVQFNERNQITEITIKVTQ